MNAKAGLLVFGLGNPGRTDDGIGAWVGERIEALGRTDIVVETGMQLNLEDAAAVAESSAVLFIDADISVRPPFLFRRAYPAGRLEFTSHTMRPEVLVAVCAEYFSSPPPAWILGIRGFDFAIGEGLTPGAKANADEAFAFISDWIGNRQTVARAVPRETGAKHA